MSLVNLEIMAGLTTLTVMFAAFFAMIFKAMSVRQSHQRYVAGSIAVICCATSAVGLLASAVIHYLQGNIGYGVYYSFLSMVWVLFTILHWNDDNWFKNQFKRLKKGFKKLRSIRINIRKPVLANPLPTPVPAPVLTR